MNSSGRLINAVDCRSKELSVTSGVPHSLDTVVINRSNPLNDRNSSACSTDTVFSLSLEESSVRSCTSAAYSSCVS